MHHINYQGCILQVRPLRAYHQANRACLVIGRSGSSPEQQPDNPDKNKPKKKKVQVEKKLNYGNKRYIRPGRRSELAKSSDTPLRDGNRDRLIGLLTRRSVQTMIVYLQETNINVCGWFMTYTKENEIPLKGTWDAISGDQFIRQLLTMPIQEAKWDVGKDQLYDCIKASGVDPRDIAQRLLEIRLVLAKEFIEDLSMVENDNQQLLKDMLQSSFNAEDGEVGKDHPESPKPAPTHPEMEGVDPDTVENSIGGLNYLRSEYNELKKMHEWRLQNTSSLEEERRQYIEQQKKKKEESKQKPKAEGPYTPLWPVKPSKSKSDGSSGSSVDVPDTVGGFMDAINEAKRAGLNSFDEGDKSDGDESTSTARRRDKGLPYDEMRGLSRTQRLKAAQDKMDGLDWEIEELKLKRYELFKWIKKQGGPGGWNGGGVV